MHATTEPDRLAELLAELGPANVDLILAVFLGDARAHLEELAAAHRAADYMLLGRVAHSLAGAAANVGAESLARHARTLEHGIATMSALSIQSQLDTMTAAFAEFAAVHHAIAA